MSVIYLNGAGVHYEVLGRGRPIIFLHGWVGSWRYWVPAMQTASNSFRAYALDLWGFGETAHQPDGYPVERQAELLRGFLEEMGIARVALVGHGLGGLVALSYAAEMPGSVDRLMAVNCPAEAGALNGRLGGSAPSELADWLLGREAQVELARAEAAKADPAAVAAALDSLQVGDLFDRLPALQVPCLFVYGGSDPAVPVPENAGAAALPYSMHHIVLENSGHFPMLEEAARFNRLLTDFLALESGVSPRELQLKEEWKRRVR
jgi:pimeloyl-ACP methyl ester carboxylesterase